MDFDPEVGNALQALTETLSQEMPGFMALLAEAKEKEWSVEETNAKLLQLLSDPEKAAVFLQTAHRQMAPLREEPAPPPIDPNEKLMFDSGVGLPRLNPLYEAALIERAQYDGDIPELRTGPLPRGIKPAVPVKTNARDPVALGHMLTAASEQVEEEIQEHEQKRWNQIEEAISSDALDLLGKAGELIAQGQMDLTDLARGSKDTDLSSYRRGELPQPVAVAKPSGSVLANLPTEVRQENAWKFLSTSQGRRTATSIIQALILENLRSAGVSAEPEEYDPRLTPKVVAHHKWEVELGGPRSTQSSFAFVDVAAKVLSRGLFSTLGDKKGSFFLEVIPINTVDIRQIGWAARLVQP